MSITELICTQEYTVHESHVCVELSQIINLNIQKIK